MKVDLGTLPIPGLLLLGQTKEKVALLLFTKIILYDVYSLLHKTDCRTHTSYIILRTVSDLTIQFTLYFYKFLD